jgi:hypothetical protein
MRKDCLTAVALVALLPVWGCNPEAPVSEESSIEGPGPAPVTPEPIDPLPPAAELPLGLSMTGQLAEVDAEAETFQLVLEDGTVETFRYTELTEVSPSNEGQGLASREGSQTTVRYDDATSPPTAIAIEIAE